MPYVTTDGLKDALTKFRAKGDAHWATKDELPTDEEIATIAERVVGEGLTEEDIAEVLANA